MEAIENGADGVLPSITNQFNVAVSYLPSILAVIVIVAIGWLLARLARRLVRQIGSASNRWLTSVFPSGIGPGARKSSLTITLISEVVFWAIILIALTIAARFAELGFLSHWLDRITAQLPNLVAGVVIVVVGYFVSVFVREHFPARTSTGGPTANSFIGRVAQALVFGVALIIALDQIGIDVALLIGLFVVVTAGLLTALAVAFASGARTHVSNLIGVRMAHANFRTGMTIQFGDIQGEIVEFTSTLIALDTDKGRVLIPGRFTDEAVITVVSPGSTMETDNG